MVPLITAVILTKNEEKNIVDCVESVSWCREIIVLDDFSDDRTLDVLKSLPVKFFKRKMNGNFSEQRNFGLENAGSEWVLFLDADERVTEELKEEIKHTVENEKVDGFYIRRVDYMWGKKLKFGETGNKKILRLGRKGAGKWVGKVHEEWNISGSINELKNEIIHFPHPTIADFLKEINYYTDLRAKELFEKKQRVGYANIIFYPIGKFLFNYFLKLGFKDGVPGLIVSILMSFHSFLVRGKLWMLWQK